MPEADIDPRDHKCSLALLGTGNLVIQENQVTFEQARLFREFKEIESRTTFDSTCGITVENLGSLIGEYHFTKEDERPCQVERDGKRCNEGHKNGWLGRKKTDGKEALIGIVCGIKYFNAVSTFNTDRKRITRELNIDHYIERLNATKGNDQYAAELERTIGRLKMVRAELVQIQDRLPKSIAKRLHDMAKAGDPAVNVQFRYEDEDDDGNPVADWVPFRIGTIDGVQLWNQASMGELFALLYEIRDTFREAQISRDSGDRKLKRWADKLDELTICVSRVTDFEAANEAFVSPSNLQLLCFVVPNQDDSLAVARVALERQGNAQAITAGPRRFLNDLSAEIRSRAEGRSFRIA